MKNDSYDIDFEIRFYEGLIQKSRILSKRLSF